MAMELIELKMVHFMKDNMKMEKVKVTTFFAKI
jgi:hypothetical protein